jgi:hypothetical protein
MISNIRINMYLLLLICCCLTLKIDGMPSIAYADRNNNKNIFLFGDKYHRIPEQSHLNLVENSPSLRSSDIQRRNVIMPRICYFARISKGGVHQKLCLPYGADN